MRAFLISWLVLLASPAVAYAAEATIVSQDLSLGPSRSVAGVQRVAPFDMVGLHWQGQGAVRFRTRSVEGRWSPWRRAAPESDLPDAGSEGAEGTWRFGNPWWAGRSDRLEVRTAGAVSRVRAWFVSSPAARVPLRQVSVARSPAIIPRRGWQANEKIVRAAPRYAPILRLAVVHHTAGSNSYAIEDSAAIVKGIQLYHVKANGWDDIGYNFLVDRYGRVFEGRGGGVDRNVVGAHAEGFNTGSVGVAVIGTYSSGAPTKEAERALAALLAWRLDVSHLDPASSSIVTSGGNPRFRFGGGVYLRAVSGHRDTGFTACPGNGLYSRLGALTEVAATTGLPKLYEPTVRGALGKVVRFSARLSQPLAWSVTVARPDGTKVAARSGTGDRVSWFWDSSGLPRGVRYTWTIEASGARPARGVLGSLAIDPPPPAPPPLLPPASGLAVSPTVVSPNADGYQDVATVRYTLSEPSSVSISLEDELGMTVIIPVIDARQQAGARAVRIDPAVVPDGAYRLVVSVRGDSSRKTRLVGSLTLNRTLGWLRADPPELTPDGDGSGDVVTISFDLAAAALVTAEVRMGGVQLGILSGEWLEAGPHGLLWDGRLATGLAPPGAYEIWVTAGNDAGLVTQKVAVRILAPVR